MEKPRGRGTGPHESPVGRTIVGLRQMSEDELEGRTWLEGAVVVMLDDGTTLYAMCDPEGNGPGVLVHGLSDGKEELIFPLKEGGLKK